MALVSLPVLMLGAVAWEDEVVTNGAHKVTLISVTIHGTEHTLTISEAAILRQQLTIAVLDTLNGYRMSESEHIKLAVCREFGLSVADLDSDTRHENIVVPRQIAMSLHRKFIKMPLEDIGQYFKRPCGTGRDHGTVLHACRAVESMVQTDNDLRMTIERLEEVLNTKQQFENP